jgi:hypothetical protein
MRKLPIMKRILSGVLRRKNGVEQRNGGAGVLPIEFIERSRNESLGIEWLFAAYGEEYGGRTGTLEGGGGTSKIEAGRAEGLSENSGNVDDQP